LCGVETEARAGSPRPRAFIGLFTSIRTTGTHHEVTHASFRRDTEGRPLIRVYLERDWQQRARRARRAAGDRTQPGRKPTCWCSTSCCPGGRLDVCRIRRAYSDCRSFCYSPAAPRTTICSGPDIGADDYVTKRTARELPPWCARFCAGPARGSPVRCRPAHGSRPERFDGGRFEVRVGDRPVVLTAKEFGILDLLRGARQVFTQEPDI